MSAAAPIIDAHAHVDDQDQIGYVHTAEALLAEMDVAGVDVAVIMTMTDAPAVSDHGVELIHEVIGRFPGRFEAYVRVHPFYGDEAERLVVRAIRDLRFSGLKLHPVTTLAHPAQEPTLRLIRAAARLGAPTMIHCGDEPLTTPLELEQVALRVPEATIVLGHMGGYNHGADAIEVAERQPNVLLETSASPDPGRIGEAVRRLGAERVIFASDAPGCSQALELAKVQAVRLSPRDERRVLFDNQRALLDRVERR